MSRITRILDLLMPARARRRRALEQYRADRKKTLDQRDADYIRRGADPTLVAICRGLEDTHDDMHSPDRWL